MKERNKGILLTLLLIGLFVFTIGASTHDFGGSGGGAPTDATYLVQTADGTLSAEQAMGALGTGAVWNTTTTGVQSINAGLTSIGGLTETNGGIPYGTADNAYAWLAAGAEGTLLMGNGAGAPSWLGAGTAGYFLIANGAADPVWTTQPTLASLEGLTIANGSIIYGTAADTLAVLAPDNGKYLMSNGAAAPSWEAVAGGGATAWDDIANPDADKTITFDNDEVTVLTFADVNEDMINIQGVGAFGDVSVMRVEQITGDATDGTVLEVVAADANVDPLVVSSSSQAGALIVGQNAGAVTINSSLNLVGSMTGKRTASAVDYNPSALTTDYIIAITNTDVARAVTISTEDEDSGTTAQPRIMIVKDESGGAAAHNITVSLESAGTIDGAASYVIDQNYQSITLYLNGTNAHIF